VGTSRGMDEVSSRLMNLAGRCAPQFDRRDWQRGEDYFRDRAVSIVRVGPDGLEALVQGSEEFPYDVRLDWSKADDNRLGIDCSCPRFAEWGACKHVAATIFAADARKLGVRVPGTDPLSVDVIEGDDDREVGHRFGHDADDEDWDPPRGGRTAGVPPARAGNGEGNGSSRAGRVRIPNWKKQLDQLAEAANEERAQCAESETGSPRSKPREIWYLLDVARTLRHGWPCISLRQCVLKKDGTRGKLKAVRLSLDEAGALSLAEDRRLLALLAGNDQDTDYGFGSYRYLYDLSDFAVAPAMFDFLLPQLCASGRFGWLPDDGSGNATIRPLAWDDGPAWKVSLNLAKSADEKHWVLGGRLIRGEEIDELSNPLVVLRHGLAIFRDRIARVDAWGHFHWVSLLREFGSLSVPVKEEQDLVERLVQSPDPPPVDWPAELRWVEERPAPVPRLRITNSKSQWSENLEGRLAFQYGDRSAAFEDGQAGWYDRPSRRAVFRDLEAENAAKDRLLAAGAKRPDRYGPREAGLFQILPAKMSGLVLELTEAGWDVEAQGCVIRRPASWTINVTSGIDWFELDGAFNFGGVEARLPELLAALRSGERFVKLGDGSRGMLPHDWLARYASLAELGEQHADRLRFLPNQAALLDVLLAEHERENVAVDQTFAQLREKLRSFEGVRPGQEPASFVGELRHYQREGLGWLQFLDEFGFGGCLADDMGLGKTIQVLAHLEQRRVASGPRESKGRRKRDDGRRPSPVVEGAHRPSLVADGAHRPSLVVVPRSLVFNWIEEARRFTPELSVLNYTGHERSAVRDRLNDVDLVVTTYGTIRRDIARLRDQEFDYAILDEAQAIKNASSQAAKACRLLRARRRLAMTGTPVENHLGELWSLFEFLNPGMLGKSRKLTGLVAKTRRRAVEPDGEREPAVDATLLTRALRPFLLRRTKQQVLAELPAKTEQTLYCELDPTDRELYEELRDHYRLALVDRVKKFGLQKSKIHVLEALLRLRQAACHPGLLDKKKIDSGSSKLETLLEQLTEVIAEGHKALVFSQFTSLLAIVRRRLDGRQMVYEYLDGKTVKRQSKVERFQTDPDCRLFLISLKAGGQGLNLTAADYVFILDPWWNPAVEAQAVDRAHRMGQQRHVFAYRLIARDTVEEKILLLQNQKRDLAQAIVSADKSLLGNLTADDLQLLLS
jgi:superfamily II DNA or RNA helicase